MSELSTKGRKQTPTIRFKGSEEKRLDLHAASKKSINNMSSRSIKVLNSSNLSSKQTQNTIKTPMKSSYSIQQASINTTAAISNYDAYKAKSSSNRSLSNERIYFRIN